MTVDRRVRRTRELLFDALLDLMIVKGYGAITVQDLIDRANVGRSTFYNHFHDKDHLLLENMNYFQEELLEKCVRTSNDNGPFGFSLMMIQHAQGYQRIYQALKEKEGGNEVIQHMKNMLMELIQNEVKLRKWKSQQFGVHSDYVTVTFIANTFFSLLTNWLDQKITCTAIELNELFHRLVLKGLSN